MKDIKVVVEKMTRNRRKRIGKPADSLLCPLHSIQFSPLMMWGMNFRERSQKKMSSEVRSAISNDQKVELKIFMVGIFSKGSFLFYAAVFSRIFSSIFNNAIAKRSGLLWTKLLGNFAIRIAFENPWLMVGKVFIHFPLYLVWPYDLFWFWTLPTKFCVTAQ